MIGHLLVAEVDPIVLSAARWIFTALLLMALYFRQVAEQWPVMKNPLVLSSSSRFVVRFFSLTLYIGLQYTTSLNAAIYMSTTPALVLLINKFFFKERISARNIAGVILSTVGVIWLVSQGDMIHARVFAHLNQGDVWTMGSAVSWAVYCAFCALNRVR